jgi:APA family basic amino acid/polyamine antiporter
LTVAAIFVLRRRAAEPGVVVAMPGHPFTTLVFVAAAFGIVANSFFAYTKPSLIGSAILLVALASYPLVVARSGGLK